MKVPYSWLAEWVKIPWSARELGSRLTMSGLELEALETAAPPFSGVVVAEIRSAERHPQADKLQVCRVSTGSGEDLQIVCGAPNARAGLKTALATVGAELPGGLAIKAARLRGVESFGMLCSARELKLAEDSAGILELPADAPVGQPLRDYLQLDDSILELNVTPNRGDAMSIVGVAREVAALTRASLTGPRIDPIEAGHPDTFAVRLEAPAACPRFAGCIIRGVNNRAATPQWMRERLRRVGLRSISPVVDVTNYVLLELGQPMHAYDLAKLRGEIVVRLASAAERLILLDGKEIEAASDVLFITDREGPVGLAGIMGGGRTAISAETTDVFLEVAYFTPEAVRGRARRFGLLTDASQRFERGVDPAGQERAANRAIALITSIAGGRAGPVEITQSREHLSKNAAVALRRSQVHRLLGMPLTDEQVRGALEALQMSVTPNPEGWQVTPPSYRFDIAIEADLIEEVARIVGYNEIPERDALAPQRFHHLPESRPREQSVLESLAVRGYLEAITFAFVDPALQEKLFPDRRGLALANPIASDLAVMRVSLWPGLLRAALENQRRQQDRIRLFEHGARFAPSSDGSVHEVDSLAGIAVGHRLPEQWSLPRDMRAPVDFFDVKGDLEALLAGTGTNDAFRFEPAALSCLHPGRSARLWRGEQAVGWVGELHPSLVRELDFTYPPVLFELDFEAALAVCKPEYREVSRFPQVRRDLSVVVDEKVALSALAERVTLSSSSLLRDLLFFDVYRGPGVEAGR
ncbi:MAG TPA: phenylalanine--tRNA ligase subunit beta, partial [Steroidobacteraceae bacterium]|nr:phenylalanine--tRNA ligase subunit beta [Steroidobacteraceae bacterium]